MNNSILTAPPAQVKPATTTPLPLFTVWARRGSGKRAPVACFTGPNEHSVPLSDAIDTFNALVQEKTEKRVGSPLVVYGRVFIKDDQGRIAMEVGK